MINKPLLAGIIGFILGGLLVSIVATTQNQSPSPMSNDGLNASNMTTH